MASWTQHPRTGLRSTRCPVHGSLVVRNRRKQWVWLCEGCIADALAALRRLIRARRL